MKRNSSENLKRHRTMTVSNELAVNFPPPSRKKIALLTTAEVQAQAEDLADTSSKSNTLLFKKFFIKKRSSILSGSSSFYLLHQIQRKDKSFTLPIPDTIIINCEFEGPVFANSASFLKFSHLPERTISYIKKQAFELFSSYKKTRSPVGLVKMPNGRKRLSVNPEDSSEHILDVTQNILIQQFLPSRGLRVSRFRVILNDNQVKVFAVVNRSRVDKKDDTEIKSEQEVEHKDVTNSLVNYSRIVKYVKTFYKSTLPDIEKIPEEKKYLYEFFKNDPLAPQKKKEKPKTAGGSDVEVFMTYLNPEKSLCYVCSTAGYSEIIKMTQYLSTKINSLILQDEVLSELAVDFMQGPDQKWFFLKIVHGLVKPCVKVVLDPVSFNKPKKSISIHSEATDVYGGKESSSAIIANLIRPSSMTESQLHKSFVYHKKLYGFE